MGRQTRFHMLMEDCRAFVEFLRERDPVIITNRSSDSEALIDVSEPWKEGETYCLWNQAIVPTLRRKFIEVHSPDIPSYYTIDLSLPVVDFWYPTPSLEPWNGRPALTQGRMWASFENSSVEFEKWYNATVRWLRKHFVRDAVILGGWIGPAAYDWFKGGGLLLPHVRPPVTESWLSWVEAQDQHRAVFCR